MASLYALVSSNKLCATDPLVQAAEETMKRTLQDFTGPNLTNEQVTGDILSAKANPLRVFSLACRKELQIIIRAGFSDAIPR